MIRVSLAGSQQLGGYGRWDCGVEFVPGSFYSTKIRWDFFLSKEENKALNVQLLVTVSIAALVASSKDKWLISRRGEEGRERKFLFWEIRERDVFLSWHSSFSWGWQFPLGYDSLTSSPLLIFPRESFAIYSQLSFSFFFTRLDLTGAVHADKIYMYTIKFWICRARFQKHFRQVIEIRYTPVVYAQCGLFFFFPACYFKKSWDTTDI
jgi:hypothetical protein